MKLSAIIDNIREQSLLLKHSSKGLFDMIINQWYANELDSLIIKLGLVEDEITLKKIRLYCEGKSVVDTMELMKLGL